MAPSHLVRVASQSRVCTGTTVTTLPVCGAPLPSHCTRRRIGESLIGTGPGSGQAATRSATASATGSGSENDHGAVEA